MADINNPDKAQKEAGMGEDPYVLQEDEGITLVGAGSPKSGEKPDDNNSNKESEESQGIPEFEEMDDEISDTDSITEEVPSGVSGRTRSKGAKKNLKDKSKAPNPTQGAIAPQQNTEHILKIKALKADILRLSKQTVESNSQLETLSKKAQTDAQKLDDKDNFINKLRDELHQTAQAQLEGEKEINESQKRFDDCSLALMPRETEIDNKTQIISESNFILDAQKLEI